MSFIYYSMACIPPILVSVSSMLAVHDFELIIIHTL